MAAGSFATTAADHHLGLSSQSRPRARRPRCDRAGGRFRRGRRQEDAPDPRLVVVLVRAARSALSQSRPAPSARRNAALNFGATDTLDPSDADVVAASHELTKGIGVDYALDAAGSARLLEAGLQVTRRGGTTVGVGAPAATESLTISPAVTHVVLEKKLLGCLFGSSYTHREVPRLLSLWRRGLIDLESMITFRRPLAEINDAYATLGNPEARAAYDHHMAQRRAEARRVSGAPPGAGSGDCAGCVRRRAGQRQPVSPPRPARLLVRYRHAEAWPAIAALRPRRSPRVR